MKYGITLVCSLFLTVALYAQPANDACVNAVDLGVAPSCEATVYTNTGATASDLGQFNEPSCFNGGAPDGDVWFAFTPSDTIEDYRITITGMDNNGDPAIIQPQVAIYRGSCGMDMLFETVCNAADPGSNEVVVDFFQPDLGFTYYIRVDDWGANGSFNICVDERPITYTIDEIGAQSCSGFLFDTGGENGNYGDNEDHVFTICPTEPHSCINMSFEFYNFESGADVLTIWDNDAPTGTPIVTLDQSDFDNTVEGAVCFEVSASSGCMTLRFQSDDQVNFEGFSAFWQCSVEPCTAPAPISVNSNVSEDDLALAIAGPETQLTVAALNCPEGHYGTFTADDSDLGLGQGIILSSGSIQSAIGPNNSPGPGLNDGFGLGDMDLDSLSILGNPDNPFPPLSEDACVLEVDVFSATDELVFEYVFGSEEYPEFVGPTSNFNDIFAFLVSGPGIVGEPGIGDQINVATLPDGTPVEINSVNTSLNWQYYRNNELGQSVQYDGLTSDSLGVKKSLTARASVDPCKTYRIKLAVADRGDGIYNSAVFVSDIQGGAPDAFFQFASGLDYLVEDCVDVPDTLVIQLENPREDSITYGIIIGGTADENLDYTFPDGIPDSITFAPGFTQIKIPVIVLSDLIDEGTETLTITFTFTSECGTNNITTVTTNINDDLEITINAGEDSLVYCVGSTIELTATGASDFVWTPAAIFDDPTNATVVATPVGDQLVQVVGTFGTCTDSATVQLIEVDPMINILDLGDTVRLCEGDTLTVFQENNVNNSNLTWENFNIFGDVTADSVQLAPFFDTELSVSVELGGCVARDSVWIDFNNLDIPTVIEDTIICEGYPIQLANIDFPFQTNYQWQPAGEFDDPTDPNAVITPTALSQTYTLITTSESGFCADTQMVTIEVIPSRIDILNGDVVEVCAPYDSVVLNAIATPVGSDIIWSPDAGVLTNFGDSLSVNPPISVTYVASYTVNGCFQSDTVLVQVDSLPGDMSITAEPFKDPYCQGDTFFLLSPIYDAGDFTGITHMWMDAPGIQTGDSLYNAFVVAQDTSLFFRITENGSCRQVDSIQINVITPPAFTLTPQDTTICLGEQVQFLFEITDGTDGSVTWTPDDGTLSCTDCFDPIATPTQATTYNIELTAAGSDCTFPISANVNIFPPTVLDVIDQALICPGSPITPFQGDPQLGVTYQITGPGIDVTDPLTTFNPTEDITLVYTAFGPCDTLTATSVITIIDPVEVDFDAPAEICENTEITFNATTNAPAGQNGFFEWSVNNVVAPDGGLQSFTTTLPAGTVVVSVTYTNDCETVSASQTIEVNPEVVLDVIDDTSICAGGSIQLNNAADPTNASYQWSGSDGFSSTDPSPTVSPTATTTYTVVATSNGVCPSVTDEVTISVIENYTLNPIEDVLLCFGESVSLTGSTVPEETQGTYVWTLPDGSTVTDQSLTIVPDSAGIFNYLLTFTDGNNCFPPQTVTFTVEALEELPEPEIFITDANGQLPGDTIFNGEQIIFTAVTPAGQNYNYTWSGNGDPATGEGDMITVTTPAVDEMGGFMTYTLTYVSERGGCDGTLTESLEIQQARFVFPNLITPNRDGVNDAFKVFYNGAIEDFSLLIFNRWGQIVYESNDPDASWDGNKDGKPQAMDVYVYKARFIQNGEAQEADGQFSLVR